ncbi:hypothetical protein CFAM422_002927 [Trichoderma lentiforme]|uniref:Uncharacterized protein n=1 Tax=Trichoderma lentiforme TaxID=1567552 RepID=A0A9P5CEQ8_9HYPO|nr:hypothetical protein CFAM422_002927 [Trichoderma lentiforme]
MYTSTASSPCLDTNAVGSATPPSEVFGTFFMPIFCLLERAPHGAPKAGTSSLKPPAREDGSFNALRRTSGILMSRELACMYRAVRKGTEELRTLDLGPSKTLRSKGDVEKLAKLASDPSPEKGIVTLVSCLLSLYARGSDRNNPQASNGSRWWRDEMSPRLFWTSAATDSPTRQPDGWLNIRERAIPMGHPNGGI